MVTKAKENRNKYKKKWSSKRISSIPYPSIPFRTQSLRRWKANDNDDDDDGDDDDDDKSKNNNKKTRFQDE